ncbi:sulfatase-like hydrolase/transferase [Nonomuraea angiospora]|uniref:sulfatase-like hydrolase/transferase n=1 Tax=Nonomuraea angiospora TaxID=46172 RepID=UPI0033DD0DF6
MRPNFVLFMPDQLRADCVGAFGNPVVRTPNIDALAARGVSFPNAYAQHSVCSPSRASLLTGQYPHTAGHRTLSNLIKPGEPNLLRYLRQAGYHVTWAGARGDTYAPGATEEAVTEYGFGAHTGTSSWHWQGTGDDVWDRVFYLGRKEPGPDHDEAAVASALEFLAAPPPEPWVLFVPLLAPHCPFGVQEPWYSLHDRAAVPLPAPRGEGREPRYMEAIRQAYGTARMSEERWRELIAVYYGMISRMDDQFGRVMAALGGSPSAGETVTMFFTDHGEYLGDYDLIEKWPAGLHDCLLREPLIMAGGPLPRGEVRHTMAEMTDLLPTVLELAGIEAEHTHFGRSLLPVIHDPAAGHREYAFSEGGFTLQEEPLMERAPFPYDLKAGLQHEDPSLVGKAVAVRDRRWTYVYRLYEPAELYDRDADPAERVNLAGRPEHAATEAGLRDAVLRWMVETADAIPWQADPRRPEIALPGPAEGAAGRRAALA